MNSRILPVLALLISVGVFFIYINPAWTGTIAETKAAIAADNKALDAAKEYTAEQNQLAAARDAIDPSNLSALTTFLPTAVDNVGLTLDLDALAARSGLSVSNIDVITNDSNSSSKSNGALPSAGQNPVGSVDLSFSALGTFSALQTFLEGIEKSQRLLDVHDLTVTGSDTGVYAYKMTIRLYWLR